MPAREAKAQSCRASQAKLRILKFYPKNSGKPLMGVNQGNAIRSAFLKGNLGGCKVE